MSIFAGSWLWLNVGFVVALAILIVALYTATLCRDLVDRRTWEMSQRLHLPFGTQATRDAISAWIVRTSRWSTTTMAIGLVLLAPLLATPVGHRYEFIFLLVIPITVLTSTAGHVAASMRERLFHPAPHVPRVARPREMTPRDYLGPGRRGTRWVFAALLVGALGSLAIVWSMMPDLVNTGFATGALVVGGLASLSQLALPGLSRLVLRQPQPAADSLELAWDDAIRTDSLGTLALGASQLSGVAAALAVLALAGDWMGFALQLPTWGMLVPQFIYLGFHGRYALRPALYPAFDRAPATQATA